MAKSKCGLMLMLDVFCNAGWVLVLGLGSWLLLAFGLLKRRTLNLWLSTFGTSWFWFWFWFVVCGLWFVVWGLWFIVFVFVYLFINMNMNDE